MPARMVLTGPSAPLCRNLQHGTVFDLTMRLSSFLSAVRLAAALLGLSLTAEAQWDTGPVVAPRVEYRTFASTAASATVSYHIWTPPVYDTDPTRRFPVLYWLHGSGSSTDGITPVSNWFSTAVAQGRIPPLLVVFPNGWPYGMWTDAKDGSRPIETVLMQELLPLVDASFRTIPTRSARIVEGFSMGGMGAGRLGFKHPQVFGAASMLGAGPLQLDFMQGPICSLAPDALRAQIYQDVWGSDPAYYLANTPWTQAQQNLGAILSSGLRVRQAVGTADCMIGNNDLLDAHMTLLGIPHDYWTVSGVRHDALALLQGLGGINWAFYLEALSGAPTGTAFCFGDGSAATCPCGNSAALGRGCRNSTGLGARLSAGGDPAADNVVFVSSGELTNSLTIFLQGSSVLTTPAVFGDGLRCAGGELKRLYVKSAVGGIATAPAAADPGIRVQSANLGAPIAPGSTRHYQAYYRDPNPSFCPSPQGNAFNSTNGVTIFWP